MRRVCFFSRQGGIGHRFFFPERSILETRSYPGYTNSGMYLLHQLLFFFVKTVCAYDRKRDHLRCGECLPIPHTPPPSTLFSSSCSSSGLAA